MFVYCSLVVFVGFALSCVASESKEFNTFTEELLIRPLGSGHVYSHFQFMTSWYNPGIEESVSDYKDYKFDHYDLFPRALGEIVEQYHVRELHLSLTQGLWRHRKWGYPVSSAPPGAQLWVWFSPTTHDIDQTWRDLVNALSGLFCASLNFIDSTNTISPELSYRPQGIAEEWYAKNSSFLRYAALPRENVCTENLTPWKKLLPCDTKRGLSTLLYPAPLYSANYHSLAIHLRPNIKVSTSSSPYLELVQSLSVVHDPTMTMNGHLDWSLRHLYSSGLFSVCPLASSSYIYVDISGDKQFGSFSIEPEPDTILETGEGHSHRAFAVYDVKKGVELEALNVHARYKGKHVYGHIPAPTLHITRFITGYGQEGGSITIKITNAGSEPVSAVYLEMVPWYLRLFLHTSHTKHQHASYVSKLVTARDRERGWLYESVVEVPASSTIEFGLQFSRALLKWLEYPPDANHGFYVPSATVSAVLPNPRNVSSNNLQAASLKEKLTVGTGPSFVRIHTETLLVSLPTPDFSMPYNVICLACTVVALAFGPIHNITTKRLTLKKLGEQKSYIEKLKGKLSCLFRKKDKEEGEEGKEPVIVEENPLYEDREELEDIQEEEEGSSDEEEEKKKDR
ncbi:phosphatidylinositol glycan anchor biosynthesis class T [Oratosquilla oratoria]|uniref:phosphatidylinositol glycan anchor biosynthesis class T n=1 Tax=Oratosquilla oratoria TaxID=337810 RepID=UPI003F75E46A